MTVRRGDLVLTVLPGNYGKPRPALVLQGDVVNDAGFGSIVVAPVTSRLSGTTLCRVVVEATPETGLRQRSEIMVEKLAGISTARLRDVIGRVDAGAMREVEQAVLLVLGFG